ncbi:MAG: hypothetical protein Q9169_003533 [Polycauliona sp. 2 TL-2023]
MALALHPRCAFCNSGNNGCLRGFAHRDAHKKVCNGIRKAHQTLDKEENQLRNTPGDFMTPANLFQVYVGHFWGIHETRPYMRSRFALVEAYLKVDTYAAVEAARSHLADMLRLCRGDNMGVRDLVPAILLRLGRDQDCYDFCKWYATSGSQSNYNWGDMEQGFLDVKNADVFEPLIDGFLSKYGDLSFTVALTLLKIRLLLDLQALQNSAAIGSKVPREILDSVRSHLVTTVICNNTKMMDSVDQTPLIRRIEEQVQTLYTKVCKQNKYFWPALLKPNGNLGARPNAYSPGGPEHMQIMLNYSYSSWKETPGAVEMITKFQSSNAS